MAQSQTLVKASDLTLTFLPHTSVFSLSKRYARKLLLRPVSKLRLRLQTVETGHYFCSPMPLRKARKLVKAGGQRYIAGTKIQYTNKKQETWKKSWKKLGKILILYIDRE